MSEPRKSTVSIKKLGKTSKKDRLMTDYCESLEYTDVASGESDSASITLSNIDKKFLNSWLPKKGEKYQLKINTYNWKKDKDKKTLNCGKFVIDDFSISGRPLTAKINMVSKPANSSFSTKQRTKTWKNVTLKQIARKIAKRYKMKLVYDGGTVKIKNIEQKKTEDGSFLKSLCEAYAYGIKIYSNKLVIYSKAKYEKKKAVKTIDEKEVSNWNFNTTVSGTYTGCKFSYTNPKTNKTIKVKVGKGSRWLTSQGEASNKADALKRAYAAVNNSNEEATTISFTTLPDPKLIATANIKLTGFGKLNGKYSIKEVKHNCSPNNGYEVTLECYKIVQRLPKPKKKK